MPDGRGIADDEGLADRKPDAGDPFAEEILAPALQRVAREDFQERDESEPLSGRNGGRGAERLYLNRSTDMARTVCAAKHHFTEQRAVRWTLSRSHQQFSISREATRGSA